MTKRRSKLVQQRPNPPLRGGLRNYKGIRTAAMGEKLTCWIQYCWSRLRQLRSVSYGFVGILYSGRLPFFYSNHLEGRQTVENHLVHTGTSSYQRTHVMTSSTSILVWCISLRFLFSRKQVCPWKSWKFALRENFSLYGIHSVYCSLSDLVESGNVLHIGDSNQQLSASAVAQSVCI